MSTDPDAPQDQNHVSAWVNIGKIAFLVAVLVAAWFLLEWLMGK